MSLSTLPHSKLQRVSLFIDTFTKYLSCGGLFAKVANSRREALSLERGLVVGHLELFGPLIRTCRAKAIDRPISASSDAHAPVAHQQKGIAAQIVAAEEFPLKELLLTRPSSTHGL